MGCSFALRNGTYNGGAEQDVAFLGSDNDPPDTRPDPEKGVVSTFGG